MLRLRDQVRTDGVRTPITGATWERLLFSGQSRQSASEMWILELPGLARYDVPVPRYSHPAMYADLIRLPPNEPMAVIDPDRVQRSDETDASEATESHLGISV